MMNCNKNMKLCPLMQHKWAISSHFQQITQPHNQFSSYSMNPTVPLIFLHSALDLSSSAMKQNTKQSIQLHSVGITESLCLLQSCIFYFFALPSSQLFCQDMWVWHQNKQHGNIFLKKRKGKNIRILGTNMSRVWDSTTSASSSFQSSVMFGKDHWCYYIYIYIHIHMTGFPNFQRSKPNATGKDLFVSRPLYLMYLCGIYVLCIYLHARWELPQTTQVFVVLFVRRLWSTN